MPSTALATSALAFTLAAASAIGQLALQPTAHQLQRQHADAADLPVHPDHFALTPAIAPRGVLPRPCRTVMGFLPYWVSPANIRWDRITHLACFDVEATATGAVNNPRGWPWTSTINTARANNVRVLLTVTNFAASDIASIVNTPANRLALANNLAALIRNTADGVVIDFEGVNQPAGTLGPPWQSRMDEFLAELKVNINARLVALGSPGNATVYVATPAWNWAGATNGWDFRAITQAADGVFIMGYDYTGSWSASTGPSAPLTGNSGINVTATIVNQYAAARGVASGKLILGVPYYGNQWESATGAANAPATRFVQSVVYSSAQPQSVINGRLFDTATQTPWYRFQTTVNNQSVWNQVWYDDAESIRAKLRMAKSNLVAGMGMWALNYDGTRAELWDVIRDEYITPCNCRADIDLSGTIAIDDLFTFLTLWFAGDTRANIDSLGGNTIDDVFVYLQRWFAGC